jgi:sigma-B regulation protein RsbU (phosphoserine phosphatase)
MKEKYSNQRQLYRLLDKITNRKYKSQLELIKSVINEVTDNEDYDILGGRIWKFDVKNYTYNLLYQYGNVKKIPDNFAISILEQEFNSAMKKLAKKRIVMQDETNQVLIDSGISHYSMTGVGDIIRTMHGSFYEYALGFNAENFTDNFYESISIISSVCTISLRNVKAESEKRKINKDYEQAKIIQQNLLPEHFTEFLDYEVFGVCVPDSDVGGDYFDYIRNTDSLDDEETLSIVISDAASKGLPAAIQSLFVSGALRMGMKLGSKISHILGLLNTLIFKTFPYERFVTLFICELTRSDNRLILYANAGHCTPIKYSPKKDKFTDLKPTGGLLGIVEHQKFGLENTRMDKGDIMLLYTDGINEAQNSNGELYGEQRLKELMKKYNHLPVRDIAYNILGEINTYSANSKYNDDMTIVVIKRKE